MRDVSVRYDLLGVVVFIALSVMSLAVANIHLKPRYFFLSLR